MTFEEVFEAAHEADKIYQDMIVSAYAKRDEKDHATRMTLARNDVRLEYPEIWDEYYRTHKALELEKHKMDVRMVEAYESMGLKAYQNKLTN